MNSSAGELVVPPEKARERLDRFLAEQVPELSRSRAQVLIREGRVRLNGASCRPNAILRRGDRIDFSVPAPNRTDIAPEQIALDIIWEDGDVLVLNKAAGMVVHPGAGRRDGTLVNALVAHCQDLSGVGGVERPGIVHRLDKETSGCLVVAKNDSAHRALSEQFATRTVDKIYLALVAGKMRRNSGTIAGNIVRHRVHRQRMMVTEQEKGRAARTDYRVVRSGAEATLLECRLHSGRTHQIRVHLQHLGHPILGDALYGGRRGRAFPRQMLHAWKLAFEHPRLRMRLHFEAPPPDDFEEAAAKVAP